MADNMINENNNHSNKRSINLNNSNLKIYDILILGSSYSSIELLKGLLQVNEFNNVNYQIIVASNHIESLEVIKKMFNIKIINLNIVKDKELLISLIKSTNLVISLVPVEYQYIIALYCLENNKHFVSTKYITKEIESLSFEAKKKELYFIFETGLIPGLDHIVSAKVVNAAKDRQSKVISYENWSGALPAPENTDDHFPFKIIDSHQESLKEVLNNCIQLIDKKVIKINNFNILDNIGIQNNFNKAFNFEAYFSKDYLKYRNYYNLKDAETIMIGSIRYSGYTFLIMSFKHLNLLSNQIAKKWKNWREFLIDQMMDIRKESQIFELTSKYLPKFFKSTKFNNNLNSDEERFFYFRLTCYALSHFDDNFISKHDFIKLFNKLYQALIFFRFYDLDNLITQNSTIYNSFSNLIKTKLEMKKTDKDIVFLKNIYKIVGFNGRLIEKSYELILYGRTSNINYTATSFLVGRVCAIVSECIINNAHKLNFGINIPFDVTISDYVLKMLIKNNIKIIEKTNLFSKF